MTGMRYSVEEIAEVCWSHNMALQVVDKEAWPDPPWPAAPKWRREIVTDMVLGVLAGDLQGPDQTQQYWSSRMESAGWTRGEKNPLRKTHPNIGSWSELESWQRLAQQANYRTITEMGAVT